jgi:hypothetical protein
LRETLGEGQREEERARRRRADVLARAEEARAEGPEGLGEAGLSLGVGVEAVGAVEEGAALAGLRRSGGVEVEGLGGG